MECSSANDWRYYILKFNSFNIINLTNTSNWIQLDVHSWPWLYKHDLTKFLFNLNGNWNAGYDRVTFGIFLGA